MERRIVVRSLVMVRESIGPSATRIPLARENETENDFSVSNVEL